MTIAARSAVQCFDSLAILFETEPRLEAPLRMHQRQTDFREINVSDLDKRLSRTKGEKVQKRRELEAGSKQTLGRFTCRVLDKRLSRAKGWEIRKEGRIPEKWRDTSPLAQTARAVTLKAARLLDHQLDLARDRLAGAASSRATQKARAGCWGRVRSRRFAGDTLQRRRNSHRHRSDCPHRCTSIGIDGP